DQNMTGEAGFRYVLFALKPRRHQPHVAEGLRRTAPCGLVSPIDRGRREGYLPTDRLNLMSHNTFGHLFRVTTFGESHGAALGCVIDGCPPAIPLEEADIQTWLDERRPGQSRFTTQRQEPDRVKILSGVFRDGEGATQLTTGTPIMLLIEN